jgi:predicted phage terminase large subunit-like protein
LVGSLAAEDNDISDTGFLKNLEENRSLRKKLTQAQFRRRALAIMEALRSEYRPFPEDTPEKQRARVQRAREDPFYFFRTYLPHYFPLRFAKFHYELMSLLDRRAEVNRALTPVVVAAPREYAKTTICAFGYVLHQFVFQHRRFILLMSDTKDLATDLTGYLYMELCYNERIIHDFGRLVRENWAVEDFIGLNDVRLAARGRGQRIRGLKHKQYRPDLIVMDDIENDKSARSMEQVRDVLNWVTGAAYSALDMGGNLFIIGTTLGKNSAMHTMVLGEEEPFCHWVRRIYRAIDENGDSLWPEKFSLEVLEEQKKIMGTVAFNREKLNLPDDDEGLFRSSWLHHYNENDLLVQTDDGLKYKELVVVGWFDPSIESGASSDYKAIVTVGYDPVEAVYYVLDVVIRKVSVDHAIRLIYALHEIYHYNVFAVEDNIFQKLLLRDFKAIGEELNQVLPYRGSTNTLSKETRVAGLSPLVERGKIRFRQNQSDQNLLIEQLLYFPSPSFADDGPDALEGAIRLAQSLATPPVDISVSRESAYRPSTGIRRLYRPWAGDSREILH